MQIMRIAGCALAVSALLVACAEQTPVDPAETGTVATPPSSAEIPTGEFPPPTYVTGELNAADVAIAATGAIIRVYQDEQPWFGLNRAHNTLVAAPPAGLGKILSVDYFIHPLADLALGIPSGTAVVLITSNSNGWPQQAATQNSAASQAALTAFLAGGGKLIVDMGDNLYFGGFIAPGSAGTPTLFFPNPAADATLTPAAAGHPLVLGPDGAPGGGDDLNNGNIDACCWVAHGNLEQGITLPGDATPLMTAGFGGPQRTIMAEYCLGPGLVILETNTKEFVGQQPVGSGPGFVMRNLFSYALTPGSPCLTIVDIDIKPGTDPNSINCGNAKGVIPVAILTTDQFDATTVDHTTVSFEGASETHVNKKTGVPRRHEEDVDGDGDIDLVFHFRFGETGIACGDVEAELSGETFGGEPVAGSDAIRTVGGSLTQLSFSFADPVGDHLQLTPVRQLNPPSGVIDLVGLDFSFDNATGDYEIMLHASAADPFVGGFGVSVALFNPSTGTTAQNPAFFYDSGNDFFLATPNTTVTLMGTDPKLLAWDAGDQVAACQGGSFVEFGPCLGGLGLPDGVGGFGTGVYTFATPPPFGLPKGSDVFFTAPPATISN